MSQEEMFVIEKTLQSIDGTLKRIETVLTEIVTRSVINEEQMNKSTPLHRW